MGVRDGVISGTSVLSREHTAAMFDVGGRSPDSLPQPNRKGNQIASNDLSITGIDEAAYCGDMMPLASMVASKGVVFSLVTPILLCVSR